jgi:hypothetical protein
LCVPEDGIVIQFIGKALALTQFFRAIGFDAIIARRQFQLATVRAHFFAENLADGLVAQFFATNRLFLGDLLRHFTIDLITEARGAVSLDAGGEAQAAKQQCKQRFFHFSCLYLGGNCDNYKRLFITIFHHV